ncbi:MAG: protein-ADP-ribose hydrolase [Blautia sp.]|nr:protein-ADP-ribose hydrolase [Blautia sp.]
MTHEEQRIWLIRELQKEETELSHYSIPKDEQSQKDLLRGLMNIWVPKPLSEEFLRIQDEYLTEENKMKGIRNLADLQPLAIDNRLYLWQGDMTTLKVDGVVNPANSQLLGCWRILHNCLDNLLHSGAGLALRQRCFEIMQAQGHEEPTGQAKITPAYNLPAKYILHTVGPIVQGRLTKEHERLLASCYTSCLNLAAENNLESIAFCCISTGVFMFPNQRAAQIAVEKVRNWLDETGSDMKVIFNVYKDLDLEIYQKLLSDN